MGKSLTKICPKCLGHCLNVPNLCQRELYIQFKKDEEDLSNLTLWEKLDRAASLYKK